MNPSPEVAALRREAATEIVRTLRAVGFEAYFVGGCVRDQLLGKTPGDFDIATSATPDEIEKHFLRTVGVGRKFGVILVLAADTHFQVATFRAESDYRDGRRPEQVTFCHAIEDAKRRDFTVNGMFFDPITGELHDWVGGREDLAAQRLRAIGNPRERFAEDHLRLLRAVRFAAQLGFEIEPDTFAAVREFAPRILEVSAERIREELVKLFRPPHAARGLDLLRDSGLLAQVLPELAATMTCEQSADFHPEGTVYEHLRLMLSQLTENAPATLPWAVLMHDIAKPVTATKDAATGSIHFYGHEKVGADMTVAILDRLKFPRKEVEEIAACVLHHMQFKDVKQMRRSTRRRMALRPTFPVELELHRLDCLGSHGRLDHYELMVAEAQELTARPALIPPLITGLDLIGLGMKPGPTFGAVLEEIREKQLSDEIVTRDQALALARERALTCGSTPTS